MSGEYISVIVEGTEKREEIQISDRAKTTTESTQANASHSVQEILGLTEEKQLLDTLVNILYPSDTKEGDATQQKGVKIQKVPENIMLRNKDYFEEHFKPRELSIGPIHAADPNLFKKELKLQLAAHFFEGVTEKDPAVRVEDTVADMKRLLEGLNRQIKELRECYDKKVTASYSDDELTWLLFLDGCAMLVFIHSYVNQELKVFNISNGQAALIQRDLFLLENQIPYQVLQELIKYHEEPERNIDLKQDLFTFFKTSSIIPKKPEKPSVLHQRSSSSTAVENDHLLAVHRKVLLHLSDDPRLHKLLMKFRHIACCVVCCFCCPCLVSNFLCCMIDRITKLFDPPQSFNKMLSFRKVQELKTAGIKFKAIDSLHIRFKSRYFSVAGHLFLPTLVVDDSTESILLNLVAYELSMDKNGDEGIFRRSWVTSYVNLLNLLIDNEQDVKDLRAAGVIRNCLNNDKEVADLIERIGSYCFPPARDTYGAIKERIEHHCRRRCAIWVAQVFNTHFSSPWSVVALLAATLVLVLTGI